MEPLESLLYVPASQPRMLERAPLAGARALVIDLEDGVPPADKAASREHVRRAAAAGRLPAASGTARAHSAPADSPAWMLRVNTADSPDHEPDLMLAADLAAPLVLLPKAEEVATVQRLAERCAAWGGRLGLLIETARGVGRVRELAGAHDALALLVYGSADYRLALGARPDPRRDWERHALAEILLAARMHDLAAVDSVYFHYRDEPGLRVHAAIARELGYDGKSCIHPSQVPVIHEIWTSDEQELAWARGVLRAWREGAGAVRGVAVLDGEMIETLHVRLAERILARAPRQG